MDLYEREHALSQIGAGLREAEAVGGRLVAIEGSPGIGKSALLATACEQARTAGFAALCARGGELEADFPFGIVRQLFEARLVETDEATRAELLAGAAGLAAGVLGFDEAGQWEGRQAVGAVASYPRLHGLYWLAANLATEQPLMLVIDDAQWADAPSLRWLDYLVARIDALPILVLVAFRTVDDRAPDDLLPAVLKAPGPGVIALEPLSHHAVRSLVRTTLDESAEDGFCAACCEATGGNPFFLRELLADLARAGIAPIDRAAAGVAQVGPTSVARSLRRRLTALGEPAVALARAVAVLGASAEHHHAAALVDADPQAVALTAAGLVDTGILESGATLRFTHPVVRASVYNDMPTALRYAAHTKAARLLAAEGATPEHVAMHLLVTPPGRDAWVVEALRDAAASALSHGTPAAASTYLRRALEEATNDDLEVTVLAELGHAEIRAGERTAVEHLEEALAHRRDPARRAEVTLELGRALTVEGRPEAASRLLVDLLQDASSLDADTVLRIDAELINAGRLDKRTRPIALERLAKVSPDLPGTSPGERLMLAHLSYETVCQSTSAALAADLARRALADGVLLAEEGCESPTYYVAAWTLSLADRVGESEAALTAGLDAARAAGSALGSALALSFRALVHYRRGSLADAEADARSVAAALADSVGDARKAFDVKAHGWHPLAVAFLVDTLVERGRLDEAETTLSTIGMLGGQADDTSAIPENMLFNPLLYARAGLRLARGDDDRGVSDLREAGDRAIRAGITTAALRDWRSTLALALTRHGESEEAWRLATEELALARAFGAPRPLAIALRAVGLLDRGKAAETMLAESVDLLRGSESRLELARSLVELGAAQRRRGERVAGRERLREALELAHQCGADALCARAREELAAAGSRPRRPVRTGVEALTASEHRVARLAAEGMSNREIAQSLFVTLKTVEWHLAQVYRKLDISGRAALPSLMRTATGAAGNGGTAPAVASGH
jgi:DNA-binding CsgD family transcriptional regulator